MTTSSASEGHPLSFSWRTHFAQPMCAILFIAVFAGVIRLYTASRLACISRDGVHFVTYARELADTPLKTLQVTTKQPGYAVMLLGVQKVLALVWGDSSLAWVRSGQALAIIGGTITCVLVFLLTRQMFDAKVAMSAGVLAAFWPHGAGLSADVLSDMPHLCLYLTGILLAIRGLRLGRGVDFLLAGIAFGLAYLIRQEALGGIIATTACLFVSLRSLSRRRRWGRVLALWLPFVMVVMPYAIAAGSMMPNKSMLDLLSQHDDSSSLFSLAATHPIKSWQAPLFMLEGWAQSGRYVISTLVFVFFLLRKWITPPEQTGRNLIFLAVGLQLVAVQLRVQAYGELSDRYLLIPVVFSFPFAAAAINAIIQSISNRRPHQMQRNVATLVAFLIALSPMAYYLVRPVNYAHAAYKSAGLWLADHADPADKIMALPDATQVMFYAGRTYPSKTWIRMKDEVDKELWERQVRRGPANWLVVLEKSDGKSEPIDTDLRNWVKANVRTVQSAFSADIAGNAAHVYRIVSDRSKIR